MLHLIEGVDPGSRRGKEGRDEVVFDLEYRTLLCLEISSSFVFRNIVFFSVSKYRLLLILEISSSFGFKNIVFF